MPFIRLFHLFRSIFSKIHFFFSFEPQPPIEKTRYLSNLISFLLTIFQRLNLSAINLTRSIMVDFNWMWLMNASECVPFLFCFNVDKIYISSDFFGFLEQFKCISFWTKKLHPFFCFFLKKLSLSHRIKLHLFTYFTSCSLDCVSSSSSFSLHVNFLQSSWIEWNPLFCTGFTYPLYLLRCPHWFFLVRNNESHPILFYVVVVTCTLRTLCSTIDFNLHSTRQDSLSVINL